MKKQKKVKGFFEDLLLISLILVVIYAIYFFVFKDNNETKEPVTTAVSKENRFFKNLYEEIKESLFTDIQTQEKIELRNIQTRHNIEELNSNNNYLNYSREKILSIRNEDISNKEISEELEEESLIEEELNKEISNSDFNSLEKEDITQRLEEKAEVVEETKLSEDTQEQKNKDDEISFNIIENEEQKKVPKNYKRDENSIDVKKSSELFTNFRNKVYENIKKNIPSSTLEKGKHVNIRVTILKDGGYEELIFVDGSIYNYDMIKEQIQNVFPLEIDESIKGIFPRYYRMKINF
ncbi:hypothetical protein CRU94_08260 [Arcobacter sp. AHV-9/2010]|uniref:hypothetical protein n=1 Tax=Arcobacter sp. AHV-9/2010 TaxID=2021861 RepID=UPI00100C14A1|nr:hypothetical protein [Arcobacter sp. CECT 9299]RXJ94749.1 hypothetical protein CRU94_08260 [Arcobacter sp. CECT 9299]